MSNQIVDAVLRNDFSAFLDRTFVTILSKNTYLPNWHLRAMAASLQRLIDGRSRRLMILIQPRIGKSLVTGVGLPAYLLMRDPATKIMSVGDPEVLQHPRSQPDAHGDTHGVVPAAQSGPAV